MGPSGDWLNWPSTKFGLVWFGQFRSCSTLQGFSSTCMHVGCAGLHLKCLARAPLFIPNFRADRQILLDCWVTLC